LKSNGFIAPERFKTADEMRRSTSINDVGIGRFHQRFALWPR
jgi:hypothetical protein